MTAHEHVTVIISLCRNPDGFLWAGDTAQTIIGSTFTFRELGASVYRHQVCSAAPIQYYKIGLTTPPEIDSNTVWDPSSA